MRRVSIVVICDVCNEVIDEEVEGSSAVTFTVRGEQREMDICDDDLYGTFLQEARPTSNRQKRKKQKQVKPFPCRECGRSFDTERGLGQHTLRAHS